MTGSGPDQGPDTGGMRGGGGGPEEVRETGAIRVTPAKNVVSAPSGAVMSGCWRTSGVASRLPAVSKRMGVPPAEENILDERRVCPNAGVSW